MHLIQFQFRDRPTGQAHRAQEGSVEGCPIGDGCAWSWWPLPGSGPPPHEAQLARRALPATGLGRAGLTVIRGEVGQPHSRPVGR